MVPHTVLLIPSEMHHCGSTAAIVHNLHITTHQVQI